MLQKHVLGHELGGYTVARKAWWMIVLILAQLNATLELGYRTGGTFVLRRTFAIPIGANPVDCGTKTGFLFVHVTIEYEIVTLFLIAYEEIVHFLYPNILRQLRYELTGCNGTEKRILELDWILVGSFLDVQSERDETLSLKQNTKLGAIALYSESTHIIHNTNIWRIT